MASESLYYIFASKPFYKQWFRRCSECSTRSILSRMFKCTCCKTYNHSRCIEKHASRMRSTTQGDDPQPTLREAEVLPSSTGADEKPSSGNAEGPQPLTKTTNPCSSDNETGAEAVEVTPVDPGDHSEVSGLGAADPENTECAQELETSDDVPRADDPNPAIVNGTADFAAPKRVDVQCSVGDDAVTAAVANEEPSSTSARNPLSPAEQPAESCCWLSALYPKTFWRNHRHLVHSRDCLVFPFPVTTATPVVVSDGDYLQQIQPERPFEQRIPMYTIRSIPLTSPATTDTKDDRSS